MSDDTEPTAPTADNAAGMFWWYGLSDQERARWMREAGDTGRAKDAWEAFKRITARAP